MKKLSVIIVAAVFLSVLGLKAKNVRYTDSHLPADTAVYCAPGDAVLHIDRHCTDLNLNGQQLQKSSYGKMQFSHYTDRLCTRCVPQQYRN